MTTDNSKKTEERIDDLGRRGYRIIQNPGLFCFGTDAVFLADFVRSSPGDKALDLCSGNGIIPILLMARDKAARVTGIEIQKESADLFRRSVLLNGLEDKINIICGDIKNESLLTDTFDIVTCNPPYMSAGEGLTNPDTPKALARHEIMCDFSDVAAAASRALNAGGRFFFVHRPRKMTEIFAELRKNRLEAKRMRFVHPKEGERANLILVEAVKDGGVQMIIEPPLIVYKAPGVYSDEVKAMYSGKE